jgi:hypothetical protein
MKKFLLFALLIVLGPKSPQEVPPTPLNFSFIIVNDPMMLFAQTDHDFSVVLRDLGLKE